MAIDFNTEPYYDDYSKSKNFYRILFKPGRAVQARELTQLQTILQNQISDFGNNVFKEGSIVLPGSYYYDDRYRYVKLDSSYTTTDIALIQNEIIAGSNTGITAKVVNYRYAEGSDPPTIFVKYQDSGSDFATYNFDDGEIITCANVALTAKTFSANAAGYCSAFTVTEGVIFTKKHFVYHDTQTVIIDKYTRPANVIVGFEINESIITSDDDSSLLDPALGSSNYFGPGADRYSIELTLATREFTNNVVSDPNFVELIRIQDRVPIRINKDPTYNLIKDSIARRTYDESGDYVVEPYNITITNHLLESNTTVADGILDAAYGGNTDLYVAVIEPGKAYIKGYEVDNLFTQYYPSPKAREYDVVNNSTITSSFGNYIYITNLYGLPYMGDGSGAQELPTVDLYNQLNSTKGSANGTKIGTAKIRHIQYYSGTVGTSTAIYKCWLFDVKLTSGSLERDVKQIYFNNTTGVDFTADVSLINTLISGSISITSTSNVITGTGTFFTTQLKNDDYLRFNSNTRRIVKIISDTSLYYDNTSMTATVSGISAYLSTTTLNEPKNSTYITKLPYNYIKTIDPTGLETSYQIKRVYERTLSSGNVTITAGTDEVFSPFSTDNYQVAIVTTGNSLSGNIIDLSGKVTRSGAPTGKILTIALGADYGSNTARIITTVTKTGSAATKKIKTLANATIDFTTSNTATQSTLSLGKADIYKILYITESSNAFGTAYNTTNEIDISYKYTYSNGQKSTFYDVGSVSLKPGNTPPSHPIRIGFQYFSHSAGDYFTVDSYPDLAYKDIPSVLIDNNIYNLRDCIDFRSKISDSGNVFSGAGSSVTEFFDAENDLLTDYEYYLPRIDKVVIDRNGVIRIVNGTSNLQPIEPPTPPETMCLSVLQLDPYVLDVKNNIKITPIDNRRFTMRDIGKIENRVKNLEYYTTLNLLENETAQLQIKDGFGFDRFKNGFIVDNFNGHSIGDVYNLDYSAAVDFEKTEIRPLSSIKNLKLVEYSPNANVYASTAGGLLTLPFTEVVAIESQPASKTENINPFDVILWTGSIRLTPSVDDWIDTLELPQLLINKQGNYDSLLQEARSKGTYGTVWGAWREIWYGNERTSTEKTTSGSKITTTKTTTGDVKTERTGTVYTVTEQIDTVTKNDVVVSSTVVPQMRTVTIRFDAQGLKPNTRVHVFFDDYLMDQSCIPVSANVISGNLLTLKDLYTNELGSLSGIFTYNSEVYKLTTGKKKFAISDSPINSIDNETYAETIFTSSGTKVEIQDQITSTRNATLSQSSVTEQSTTTRSTTDTTYSYKSSPSGGSSNPPVVRPPAEIVPPVQPASPPAANLEEVLAAKIFGTAGAGNKIIQDSIGTGLAVAAGKAGYSSVQDMYNAATGNDLFLATKAQLAIASGTNAGVEKLIAENSLGENKQVYKDLAAASTVYSNDNKVQEKGSRFGNGLLLEDTKVNGDNARNTDNASIIAVNQVIASGTPVVSKTPAIPPTVVVDSIVIGKGGSVTMGKATVVNTTATPVINQFTTPLTPSKNVSTQTLTVTKTTPSKGKSDARLKENIVKIKNEHGINIYSWNYIWDKTTRFIGVIAQELLETKYKNSVIKDSDGYYSIDYSLLPVKFKKVSK